MLFLFLEILKIKFVYGHRDLSRTELTGSFIVFVFVVGGIDEAQRWPKQQCGSCMVNSYEPFTQKEVSKFVS